MTRIGSLFSGSGMLDEAVRSVLGGEVVWHAEHEPATEKNPNPTQAAARVLAYRYPGVPNLGDISRVDWATVPSIDVLTGGFPCQDVSHAGRRAGLSAGTRSGLWARMCDAIEALRPATVVIENVRGLSSAEADSAVEPCPGCVGDGSRSVLRALGRVLGDLAELGYDAQWVGLPASDVGAPHERFRYFILAQDPHRSACDQWGLAAPGQAPSGRAWADVGGSGRAPVADADRDALRQQPVTERRGDGAALAELNRQAVSDTTRDGRREGWTEPAGVVGGSDAAQRSAPTPAHADSDGLQSVGRQLDIQRHTHRRDSADIAWGEYEPAIRRWERALGRPAPAPTERGTRGGQRLSRWFDEFMMGWPDGWVTDVPGITYREAITICGNGVVPQQAAAAVRYLLTVATRAA